MEQENQNNDVFVVNGVANYSFVKESINKVTSLTHLLGIFYHVGWHYKQWREIKKNNESYRNISPFWRGVFYLFFYNKLRKIILGLFETKMNSLVQNENFPEKERKQWEKELKALKSSFVQLRLLQTAINKFVPLGHPQGKTLTWADFLGLPPFILLILFIIGVNFIPTLFGSCFEAEGNILKNNCENFSFTFPLSGQIGIAQDNNNFDNYCQGPETNFVCLTELDLDDPADFKLETIAGWENNKILSKSEKEYAGNVTFCFQEETPEKDIFNACYMKVKGQDHLYFRFLSTFENNGMENLEKLMNSYKAL